MQDALRELFRDLADTPREERERILAERRIPAEVRAELECLLRHDGLSDESLTRLVSDVAGQALRAGDNLVSRHFGPTV